MNTRLSFLVATVWTSVVYAQALPELANTSLSLAPARVWEVPALGYGGNAWSIVRLSNDSESPATFQVDVYCGNGDRLPLGSTFTIEPHQTSDIRIDGATTVAVLCWARVAELSGAALSGIQLRAFLETLSGNQLEDFDRQPGQAIENSTWALPAMEIAGQQLYILNASDKATMLTFWRPTSWSRKPANGRARAPLVNS